MGQNVWISAEENLSPQPEHSRSTSKEVGSEVIQALTHVDEQEAQQDEFINIEVEVLKKFWHIGRASASQFKSMRSLFVGFNNSNYKDILRAIDSLKRRGIIILDGDKDIAELNMNRISEIKDILGR